MSETKWTDQLLDQMRLTSDDFADKAAAALFESFQKFDRQTVTEFMRDFASRDFSRRWEKSSFKQIFPKDLVDYFESYDEFHYTPEEREILEKGAEFFTEHGPAACIALGVRSLLKQYAHTKAIQVLRMTTLLEEHVNRRIMETIQFTMDVMEPGWHEHDEQNRLTGRINIHHPGVQSIKKLRLLHAMVRYRILNKMTEPKEGDWDMAAWDHPINQSDMVFAIHTFSIEVLQGLIETGQEVSKQQIDDYFTCWRLIGRGLGVTDELEPANYKDGCALQDKIYERNFTLPNEYGPVLAEALMDWMDEIIPVVSRESIMEIVKHFNGPENYYILSDHLHLDIGDTGKVDLNEHLKRNYDKVLDRSKVPASRQRKGDDLTEVLYFTFMENLLNSERGGKDQHFRIGDGFKAAWNLNRMDEVPPTGLELVWVTIKSLFEGVITWVKGLFGSK